MRATLRKLEEAKGARDKIDPRVKRLREIQDEDIKNTDAAYAKHLALEEERLKIAKDLGADLRMGKVDAHDLAVQFALQKLAVGDEFGSRFVDEMAARGGKIYPEEWPVERSRWVFIER